MNTNPDLSVPPSVSSACPQKRICWNQPARRYRRPSRIHLLFAVVLLFIILPVAAQTITTRTLDFGSGGDTGQYSSQAVINGNPAIAYYNVTDTSLMFARNSAADGSGSWTITTVDFVGVVGKHCSLKVVNGNPAISYYDETSADLKFVRALDANGTTWSTPVTIDSAGNVGTDTSLAVINGNPAISYFDATNGDLKYVRSSDSSGTSWGTSATLDSTDYGGQYTSLVVVNGNPAICYYYNSDLKYIRANTTSGNSAGDWGVPLIVDSSGDMGKYASMAVVNGNPAISYYNDSNDDLKYVRALDSAGTTWGAPVTLDSSGAVGLYTSLAVINGNPAISYYTDSTDDLKYVRANTSNGTLATDWGTPVTLDSTGSVGLYTSLNVINGRPAISYYNSALSSGDLKFIRANDATGATWAASTAVDTGTQSGNVGLDTSQNLVNGHPSVSYFDNTNGDLKYVRALDATGTSWGAPVTIDSAGLVGSNSSLTVVDGNPAICYHDATNRDLKYVRATDPSGTTWSTPITLDSTGDVGTFTSMTIVDGNPAIAYRDSINEKVKYIRATTASGTLATEWSTPVSISLSQTTFIYQKLSLVVVSGNPAISYLDPDVGGDLAYVRSNTPSGTLAADWGSPRIIDPAGAFSRWPSMTVIDGHTAISYFDASFTSLNCMRALDSSGMNWGTPVIVSDVGSSVEMEYTSLSIINGRPAISYRQRGSLDGLKFVHAHTISGALTSDWGTPVTLDSSGGVGAYSSLVAVNGNPAISYYDSDNRNLKWATYIAPPSVPEIALSGNGQNITNGDMTPDAVDGTSYGSVAVTGGPVTRTFTITNSGTGALTLTSTAPDYVTLSGSSAFIVTTQPASPTVVVGGGTQTFQISFDPATIGPHTATISISSSDADENPFNFTVNGQGVTAEAAANAVIAAAGLTGNDALPTATPFNDGVENLLKYAFNMNLAGPDASSLPPGTGTSGLPSITTPPGAPAGTLRYEFLRRKGSGLVYTPQKSSSLDSNNWMPLGATPVITPIPGNEQFERVTYVEPPAPVPASACFGRVSVLLP